MVPELVTSLGLTPYQFRPNHARFLRIGGINSSRQRVWSISSIRKIILPPDLVAKLCATLAAYAWPRCKAPVGLGAKRVTKGRLMAAIRIFFLLQTYRFMFVSSIRDGSKVGRYGPFCNLTVAMGAIAQGVGDYLWRCEILVTLLVHL